jgi:hypothetical protein
MKHVGTVVYDMIAIVLWAAFLNASRRVLGSVGLRFVTLQVAS